MRFWQHISNLFLLYFTYATTFSKNIIFFMDTLYRNFLCNTSVYSYRKNTKSVIRTQEVVRDEQKKIYFCSHGESFVVSPTIACFRNFSRANGIGRKGRRKKLSSIQQRSVTSCSTIDWLKQPTFLSDSICCVLFVWGTHFPRNFH